MKKTPQKATAPRKSTAKAKIRGNITNAEIQRLIMVALEAYRLQDPGISFDEWRSEQVMEAVNRDGLTACDSGHFCDLMGHFFAAAGNEQQAMYWFMRAGKNAERQTAFRIVELLRSHQALSKATEADLATSTPPRSLKRRLEARANLLDHPEGPLTVAYLLTIVRDKTRRPTLEFGPDLKAFLAERCTVSQLIQIRFTLVNRIAEREGRGNTSDRNQSQNSEPAKAARAPGNIDLRW